MVDGKKGKTLGKGRTKVAKGSIQQGKKRTNQQRDHYSENEKEDDYSSVHEELSKS